MTLTRVRGTFKNSLGQPLVGKLEVALDASAIDLDSEPYALHLTEPGIVTLDENGDIDIELLPTVSATYRFRVYIESTTITFRTSQGNLWLGATHKEDGYWYSGAEPSEARELLSRAVRVDQKDAIAPFHARVPDRGEIYFSDLLPSGVTNSNQDTSILAIAEVLTRPEYAKQLPIGQFNLRGAWNGAVVYAYYDAVSLGGTSYVWRSQTQGNVAPPNADYWQVI